MRKTGPKPKSVLERFWAFVSPENDNGCMLWTGYIRPDGYGNFNCGGGGFSAEIVAHRFSYQISNLIGLTDDVLVCHRCDVRACVNPEHLFAGSQSDNLNDMHQKGRHPLTGARGERNSHSKITADDVLEIRRIRRAKLETQQRIADRYGITQAQVSDIERRVSWKHLPVEDL